MKYDGDFFNESASGSRFSKIIGGFIVPLVPLLWGLTAMITQKAVLPGRHGSGSLPLHGIDAVLFGAALICLGIFLHIHYYWTVSERLCRWADLAKVLIGLLGLAAFLTMIVRVLLWG